MGWTISLIAILGVFIINMAMLVLLRLYDRAKSRSKCRQFYEILDATRGLITSINDESKNFNAKLKKVKDNEPVAWEVLADERIKKHKKAGLVLRGIRYRENMSQKKLANESGVSQNEISKIENGKRAVGKKVAQKLAAALNIDYRLLIEESAGA